MSIDFDNTRRDLAVLRNAHGADTPIGHICSNIIELIDTFQKETDPAARARQTAEIARQGVALAVLISSTLPNGRRGSET